MPRTRWRKACDSRHGPESQIVGDAGIPGNAQDPVNWGPPNLIFTSIEGLADGTYTFNRNQRHAWNAESLVSRGRHTITLGGDIGKISDRT